MFISIWNFLIVNFENYEVLTNLKFAANVNENENLINGVTKRFWTSNIKVYIVQRHIYRYILKKLNTPKNQNILVKKNWS